MSPSLFSFDQQTAAHSRPWRRASIPLLTKICQRQETLFFVRNQSLRHLSSITPWCCAGATVIFCLTIKLLVDFALDLHIYQMAEDDGY
jgi:hypothetical protein